MLNDFSEINSNTINITAYSSTTFTPANEVNVDIKVANEPIVLTADQSAISSGKTYRNARGTIYSEQECLYVTKVWMFPFTIDRFASLTEYYIPLPEYKAANQHTSYQHVLIAARELPILSSNQINQPTAAEINPDSQTFTSGFFSLSNLNKNAFLQALEPGTFKPTEKTLFQAGFDTGKLGSDTTELNPGVLFNKIMISTSGNVGTNSQIRITREGETNGTTRQAFIIIGVEQRNAQP